MAHPGGCARCGDDAPPRRPSPLVRVVLVVGWAVFLLLGACCALMLPLNLVLVPCWLACASAVGPLARRATELRCGSCGAGRGAAHA